MTIFQFLGRFLLSLWTFFRIPFPGTNVPIAGLLFLPGIISLALAFLRNLFGIGNFADLSKVPFMAAGGIRKVNERSYNRVTSHADSVASELSRK